MNARLALCLLAAAIALPATAEHEPANVPMPQVPAEQQKMMEAWAAAGTPGKHHAYLEPMVGTFDVKVSSWMEAGQPVMESTGRSENRFIFGGRHLEQRFSGSFMDQPFEGIGYTGYDNVKKEYTSVWIDSMGTATMVTTGQDSEGGKTLTFGGECTDPLTGKAAKLRQVLRIKGPNEHVFEMFTDDKKTGKEFKTMELVYERAASAMKN